MGFACLGGFVKTIAYVAGIRRGETSARSTGGSEVLILTSLLFYSLRGYSTNNSNNDIYFHLFDRQLQFLIPHLLVMSREFTNLNSPSWCCSSAVILPTGRLNLIVKYSNEVTTGYRQTDLQFTKIHEQQHQHQSTLKYTCHDYIHNACKGISSFSTCE